MVRYARFNHGFTLLEILLVVAAIAILASIVLVAINPNKQLEDTRDAQRRSDINSLLNAAYQYAIDNNGVLPPGIDSDPNTAQVIGTNTSGCSTTCSAVTTVVSCVDLSEALAPTYLVDIPIDPTAGDSGNTNYYVNRDENGRLTVGACNPEQSATINVTR